MALQSDLRVRNEKPRLEGTGLIRPEPGTIMFGDRDHPRKSDAEQAEKGHFFRRRSFDLMRAPS